MSDFASFKKFLDYLIYFVCKFYHKISWLKLCIVGLLFSGISFGVTLEEAKVKALEVFQARIAPVARANGIDPNRCILKSDVVETVQEFFFVIDCGRMAGAIVLDKNLEVVIAEIY